MKWKFNYFADFVMKGNLEMFEPPYPPSYRVDSITAVLLQE